MSTEDTTDNNLEIAVTGFVRNEGTIVLLKGIPVTDYLEGQLGDEESEKEVSFACEPRLAVNILEALDSGGETPIALVPAWAVWGPA